ncbi:hypothetical protein TNIN_282841 [Trichonephila inaurata madagascariensis]|uniref:Uncharacterized protein n=1 Tax=Trichonephila inaurata madagascariensis TaxID=2747483 RepID=A0A8X6YRR8_9ARAC|nr:hypothetical protein TNIN_282841 [Trichonephila inaurata madagascariensis]
MNIVSYGSSLDPHESLCRVSMVCVIGDEGGLSVMGGAMKWWENRLGSRQEMSVGRRCLDASEWQRDVKAEPMIGFMKR